MEQIQYARVCCWTMWHPPGRLQVATTTEEPKQSADATDLLAISFCDPIPGTPSTFIWVNESSDKLVVSVPNAYRITASSKGRLTHSPRIQSRRH